MTTIEIDFGKTVTWHPTEDTIAFLWAGQDDCWHENPLEDWDATGRIYSFSNRHINHVPFDPDIFGRYRCPECDYGEDWIEFDYIRYKCPNCGEGEYNLMLDEQEDWGECRECGHHQDGVVNWEDRRVVHCTRCRYESEDKEEWREDYDDRIPLGYFEHGRCDWHISGEIPRGTEGDYRWDGTRLAGYWEPEPDKYLLEMVEGLDPVERRAKMVEFARQACELYTQWCNGDVYGYAFSVYKYREPYDLEQDYRFDDAIHEDSCWGFYGWEYFEEEVQSVIEKWLPKEEVADATV